MGMLQQRWRSKGRALTDPCPRIKNGRVMRTLQCMLLIAALGTPLAGQKVGYVHCESPDNLVLVYSSPPISIPLGNLNCGEQVQVLGRRESWLRVSSADGERYVAMATISQRKNRFVALNLPLPPESRMVDQRTGTLLPRATSSPSPEYTQAAFKAGIHGFVTLELTVSVDGKARGISVVQGLGYGLDESAVTAVQSWKFEPALRNGVPVDSKIAWELEFPPKSP
jgi:TonB family protein